MWSTEGILRTIRTETNPLHQKLEQETALSELMSENLTEARYRSILRTFYKRLSVLEETVFPDFRVHFPDFELNSRIKPLQEDLGISSNTEIRNDLSGSGLSEMQLLGIAYVWEGSKLGGQLISRALTKHFGNDFQTRFFGNPDSSTGADWKNFRELLLREIDSSEKLAVFIGSANAEFKFLYEEFLSLGK